MAETPRRPAASLSRLQNDPDAVAGRKVRLTRAEIDELNHSLECIGDHLTQQLILECVSRPRQIDLQLFRRASISRAERVARAPSIHR
jgi:hypothetical protein